MDALIAVPAAHSVPTVCRIEEKMRIIFARSGTTAQCRFEWNLTGRISPAQVRCSLASCHSSGVFGAVKGGRSPAQRTLDGIEKAFTLTGLGLDAGFASCPRARPAARTSPPSWAGLGVGNSHDLAASRFRRRVKFHSKRHRAGTTDQLACRGE